MDENAGDAYLDITNNVCEICCEGAKSNSRRNVIVTVVTWIFATMDMASDWANFNYIHKSNATTNDVNFTGSGLEFLANTSEDVFLAMFRTGCVLGTILWIVETPVLFFKCVPDNEFTRTVCCCLFSHPTATYVVGEVVFFLIVLLEDYPLSFLCFYMYSSSLALDAGAFAFRVSLACTLCSTVWAILLSFCHCCKIKSDSCAKGACCSVFRTIQFALRIMLAVAVSYFINITSNIERIIECNGNEEFWQEQLETPWPIGSMTWSRLCDTVPGLNGEYEWNVDMCACPPKYHCETRMDWDICTDFLPRGPSF